MATSRRRPSCPHCALSARRIAGGEWLYTPCERPDCLETIRRGAARRAAEGRRRAAASAEDWRRLRRIERGGQAEDMGEEEPYPNPRRRNSDENRRELQRRVGAGDTTAVLRLLSDLLRAGIIPTSELEGFVNREVWTQAVARAHDAARKIEACLPRNEHGSYSNYETWTVATTLENAAGLYNEWARPTALRLWDMTSDRDRSESNTTWSGVAVLFGDMIERAVAGWAPEDPIRTFSPRNLKDDLEPEILAAGEPWPRDRGLLGNLFTHLLRTSLDRVQWTEIGSHWLHMIVPESEGYGAR